MNKKDSEEVKKFFSLFFQIMKVVKIYNKCSESNCKIEKEAIHNDITANSLYKTNIKLLDSKNREKHIKNMINNKLVFNFEKCNYNKCNKLAKKIYNLALKIGSITDPNKKTKLNEFHKEIKKLVKLQKLSDDEIKKLIEFNIRITLT